MIGLLLRLWFAIVTQSVCTIGQPVDYYAWMDAHEHYRVAWSSEKTIFGDYWLMKDQRQYLIFKFKQPIDETIASGASHGECARLVQ